MKIREIIASIFNRESLEESNIPKTPEFPGNQLPGMSSLIAPEELHIMANGGRVENMQNGVRDISELNPQAFLITASTIFPA